MEPQLRFSIQGMTCQNCVRKVEQMIEKVDSIETFHVQLSPPQLVVTPVPQITPTALIALANNLIHEVSTLGYSITTFIPHTQSPHTDTIAFQIDGMSCKRCIAKVRAELDEVPGIPQYTLSLDSPQLVFSLPSGTSSLSESLDASIRATISELGYTISTFQSSSIPEPPAATTEPPSAAPPSCQKEPSPTNATPLGQPPEVVTIAIEGMTCSSCVARVQNALRHIDGVKDASVNFATEEASVTLLEGRTLSDDTLESCVISAGYKTSYIRRSSTHASASPTPSPLHASPPQTSGAESRLIQMAAKRDAEADAWKRRWIAGVVLVIPIWALQMGPMILDAMVLPPSNLLVFAVIGYLTALLFYLAGKPFFVNAWQGIKHGNLTMDTLVALGSSVAFASSTLHIVLMWFMMYGYYDDDYPAYRESIYYEGAAMIVTLIAVGKWLEARAKGEAGRQLESLLKRAATTATLLQNNTWVEVDAQSLQVGDVVLVKPGEKIPSDGIVISGVADIDCSMVTGESLPVTVEPGSNVTGATINLNGSLQIEISRRAADSLLAKIAEQVERAQATRASIQNVADRISSIFVPVVIVIAIATFITWLVLKGAWTPAILPAIAVLVVACPCALGLATPTAMMVGSAWAAKRGILINQADALEHVRSIEALVFDKTGTLTSGAFSVTAHQAFPPFDNDSSIIEVIRATSALEQASEHPLATAVVAFANTFQTGPLPPVDSFTNSAGRGLTGQVDGKHYRIGKPSWILTDPSCPAALFVQEQSAKGHTCILVERDHVIVMAMALGDTVKPEAANVLNSLKKMKVTPWLITGDNLPTAQAVAQQVGISLDHVIADTLPEDKATQVAALQANGLKVAMVGDGVNDAPALAQADLGIAMGTGTDVAMETADITLVSGDLRSVVNAMAIARATYTKIRHNMFWAFIYNITLIPVAALGWLAPGYAAGAMALSSFTVVSNSLLLRKVKETTVD